MKAELKVTNFAECEVAVSLTMSWADAQILCSQLQDNIYPSYLIQRALAHAIKQFQSKTESFIDTPAKDKTE